MEKIKNTKMKNLKKIEESIFNKPKDLRWDWIRKNEWLVSELKTNHLIDLDKKMNIDDLNRLNELRDTVFLCGDITLLKDWENYDEYNKLNKIYNQLNNK